LSKRSSTNRTNPATVPNCRKSSAPSGCDCHWFVYRDTTIILREWYHTGDTQKWIIPGWAANSDLIKAVGPEAAEGIISVESVSNEGSDAFKAYDAAYQKAINAPGLGNAYARWLGTWSSFLRSLLRRRQGRHRGHQRQDPRDCQFSGKAVATFSEGKAALKAGKINYEGASSALDFDEYGDVTPDFKHVRDREGKTRPQIHRQDLT